MRIIYLGGLPNSVGLIDRAGDPGPAATALFIKHGEARRRSDLRVRQGAGGGFHGVGLVVLVGAVLVLLCGGGGTGVRRESMGCGKQVQLKKNAKPTIVEMI